MYEIEFENFGNIFIRKNQKEVLLVKRTTNFYGKVLAEYFVNGNLILKTESIKSIFWKLKIIQVNDNFQIKEIGNYNLFKTKFNCNNAEIEINDNPFYLINKKYSTIKFSKSRIGVVKMKNRIGVNKRLNLLLTLDFSIDDTDKEFDSLLCYAITCNLLNAG
ncbi:hypothetical protein [Chryseobacterium sp.]|uniref:hypothetical protein n=1 Tax=Chryseobacterium sp. TaxID=1871047 RepID=UPI0011CC11FE|nr:hypothetical protein [Chryseobacterium sp.]TXF77672.1 hypothetical protein FUA25_07030 [Chryseobacterium sp.]